MVIWVKNFQTQLMVENISKSLDRDIGKALLFVNKQLLGGPHQ